MRTMRDAKIETRAARDRLKPGRETHYKTLLPGQLALGYRRKEKDQPGLWLLRRYIGNQRYRVTGATHASGAGPVVFPRFSLDAT